MKVLKFLFLIVIILFASCKHKKSSLTLVYVKTLDSIKIKIKNYQDYWKLEDTLLKFIEPYSYKKHCEISNLKAERDILNNHITYFRVNDTLVGSRSTDSLFVILKNKFNINSFDPYNGCLRNDSTKYAECYEYKMNNYIKETYGNNFIDSLKSSLDSSYISKNKNKTFQFGELYFKNKNHNSPNQKTKRDILKKQIAKNIGLIENNGYTGKSLTIYFVVTNEGLIKNIRVETFKLSDIEKNIFLKKI